MRWLACVLLLAAPQDESTLKVIWGPVRVVDPALAVTPQDLRVTEALFDGLRGAEAAVDGAVVTFKLPDHKWSDGRPVVASDYRYAWLRCLRPSTGSPWAFRFRRIKNALAWYEAEALGERLLLYDSEGAAGRTEIAGALAKIGTKRHAVSARAAAEAEKNDVLREALKAALITAGERADVEVSAVGIAAVDARTLRVTLESPHPGFVTLARTTPFLPVPEHVVRLRHDQWTHPDNLVTCGAFAVEKWTRQGLVLAREGGGPGVKRVSFITADLTGVAWPVYESGLADWVDSSLVPEEKIEALVAKGEIRSAPGRAVSFLRWNRAAKPGLRRAVALAINRASLAKNAAPGSAETRTLAGGAEAPAQDLVAAMTALAAEYPDLKTPRLKLLVWKLSSGEDLARGIREELEESLALSIRIDLREGPAYREALAAEDYDLALGAFEPEVGDPAGILDLFQDGRATGEKKLLDDALAIPLIREGEWFAAKPRVGAQPGTPLSQVVLKK